MSGGSGGVEIRYLASFLDGVSDFFSPCLLTLLPIYISYFAGGDQRGMQKTIRCALGFILGASAVFAAMDSFPAWAGRLLRHQRIVNWIGGSIVTVFGLNALGLFRWNRLHGGSRVLDAQDMTFFSSALFGVLLAAVMMPCAAGRKVTAAGAGTYCLGLSLPFLICAVLTDGVKETSIWVKRHSQSINLLSGSILIITGLLTASGILGRLLRHLCQYPR